MPVWPAPRAEPHERRRRAGDRQLRVPEREQADSAAARAFAIVRVRHPRARLLLVGPEAPGLHLEERIERLGLADAVERHGYVDEQRFWSLLGACDVCLARWPTKGETSAGVIRMLSLAKPIVVSDVDAFAELPMTSRSRSRPTSARWTRSRPRCCNWSRIRRWRRG